MSVLSNKVDFVAIISVDKANANGDPLNGNRPRTDYDGYGEMSDVCIKRKIRNRMQDMGHKIFVQSNDRADDGMKNLAERAKDLLSIKNEEEYAKEACRRWLDVRTFGQVFAFKGNTISCGVRGPVSIHQAVSVDPIEVYSLQITKSVNGENTTGKASDTMGQKHFVKFGLYEVKGSINVQLAEKTGFTEDDANVLKECIKTLFVNDSSSSRPDGSMEVVRLYWWQHNCKDGQYSSAKVHRSVKITLRDGVSVPKSVDDYIICNEVLEGLNPEIVEGI